MKPQLLLGATLLLATGARAAQFYVAPDGDDANAGTKEKPFATLEKARAAVRAAARPLRGAEPVTVWLRGGDYRRTATFALSEADSGMPQAPVTYAAVPGERVRLLGTAALDYAWFAPVTDEAILQRVISAEARPRLLQCNLKAHGVTELGQLQRRGFGVPAALSPATLYVNGQRQTLARWPNADQHFPKLLWQGDSARRGVVARRGIVEAGPTRQDADFMQRGGVFQFDIERPLLWTRAEDLWLDGVFSWSWEWSYNKVAKLDAQKRQIFLAYGEYSGLKDVYSGNFFFAENLLEEIDQPGEYYVDRARGVLYLLPGAGLARGAQISLSTLGTNMIEAKNASDLVLRGLTLDGGRGNAIAVVNGRRVRVEQCEIRNFGGNAVNLTGSDCAVSACHIHDVGGGGVTVGGGDVKTLQAARNRVEDCNIHDWGWFQRVYTFGVEIAGVGQVVAHNRLANCPHGAVTIYGNDHLFEYNDVSRVCLEFIDLGAVYVNVGERPLERGWNIRRNYFHDIANGADAPINVNGVYIDHGSSGGLIEENIFHRIGYGGRGWASKAVVASGLHTVARRNIFVDCPLAFHCSPKEAPADYLAKRYANYRWADYFGRFDLARMPHLAKYPEAAPLFAQLVPGAAPLTTAQMWNRFEDNLIWNPNVARYKPNGISADNKTPEKTPVLPLVAQGNWLAETDPGFENATGNLTLRADAAVFTRIPGFAAVPFAQIGPR